MLVTAPSNRLVIQGGDGHIRGMATTVKKATDSRRSAPSAGRPVVYHGIKSAPIAGKRSPLAWAIRDARRARSESADGEAAHG